MKALLSSLAAFLYPAQCRHCGENLSPSHGHYICKSCWQRMKFIEKPYCQTCGYPLNPNVALPDKVTSCNECPENLAFRKARSVAIYDSAAGEGLRLLKYQGKTVMAKPLSDLMIKAMPLFFGMEHYDFIIPVPLHKKRRRKRGFNQVELIGQRLSRATGIPMEANILIKTINTPPQAGLSYKERLERVPNLFRVVDSRRIAGKKVLLIDDVLTTGITACETAKVLVKEGGVGCVDVFTLLRVVKSG